MAIFDEKIEIPKRCKGVHCVDLGESFPTRIYLQKSASIQPRTSPSKFGGKFNSTFTSLLRGDSLPPAAGGRAGARGFFFPLSFLASDDWRWRSQAISVRQSQMSATFQNSWQTVSIACHGNEMNVYRIPETMAECCAIFLSELPGAVRNCSESTACFDQFSCSSYP